MALVIRITDSSGGQERVLSFERSPIRLGRNPKNEIVLNKPFVSQWHAQIDFLGNDVSLTDLGSTNGTSLNGQRLSGHSPVRLMIPNDYMQIGTLQISFGFAASPTYDSVPSVPSLQYVQTSPSGSHRMALRLRIDDGSGDPERILSFESSPVRLGRNKLNEIVLNQPFVSQWHALFRFEGQEIVVMDLGSTNGTSVNGQRLQPQAPVQLMFPADTVDIGTLRIYTELAAAAQQRYEPSMVSFSPEMEGDDTLFLFNAAEWLAEVRGKAEAADHDPAQLRRMMNRLSRILETFGRSYVELRDGFEQFGNEMGLTITTEDTPLNNIESAREVFEYLLDADAGSDARVEELRRAFTDLALHQVALLNGVMAGVRDLLQELSPGGKEAAGGWSPFRASSVLQEVEQKRQSLLEEDRFTRIVFGKAFARAYFAVTGQRSGGRNH
jgi:type VI secretion system protein ImpI